MFLFSAEFINYNSVAYDAVKTRLTESQAKAEEQINHSANSRAL